MPLPAINRLPLRKERDRLTREGRSFHIRHFTIVTAPTSSRRTLLVGNHQTSSPSVIPSKVEESPSSQSSLRGGQADAAISLHPIPRFSILLSKKTARLAVDRNRIKRRTSALLAELLPQFPPADYLVIPNRSVLDTPRPDLLSDLASLKLLTT